MKNEDSACTSWRHHSRWIDFAGGFEEWRMAENFFDYVYINTPAKIDTVVNFLACCISGLLEFTAKYMKNAHLQFYDAISDLVGTVKCYRTFA